VYPELYTPAREPPAANKEILMEADETTPTGAGAFKLSVRRLSTTERIVGGATSVLLVSLFLPWFGASYDGFGGSVDGLWHGYMYVPLLVSLALGAYLISKAGWERPAFKLAVPEGRLFLVGTAANFVLVLISFITKPDGASWQFGAYVGILASTVAVAPLVAPALIARRSATQA
jgi:hypothetical protein